jgi:heat shock protein HslJ
MKRIISYFLIIAFILSGCKKDNSRQPSLLNTNWILSFIQNTKTNVTTNFPADESNKIVIDFTNSLDIVSFSGICNSGEGKYSFSASGTLEITDLGSTKIACKYVEWEGYTIQSLQEAYSYSINGNNMMIYSNGDYNLYFIKK